MARNSQTYDNLLLLKDAGALTATGAGTVGGSARVLDLGPGASQAKVIIDSSALTTGGASGETYRVALQGSNDLAFSTSVELGSVAVTGTGRTEMHFTTRPNDTIYRYVRSYFTVGGTSPSINATAFIAKE